MIPGSANPLLLASAAEAGAYEIERSVRLNSSDSAYFSRTPASAGNRKTWTWAGWVKRSTLGVLNHALFGVNSTFIVRFTDDDGGDGIRIYNASPACNLITSSKFRDPSAWYHIVIACDTTQATSSNRVKVYVNNVLQTDYYAATYPALNDELGWNSANSHGLGAQSGSGAGPFSGYLADVHFIDGQALDPTSFGEFDTTTGVWNPIEYTGTYGTNGFHLPFSDNSSAAALGTDTSGAGNDWTVHNLSVIDASYPEGSASIPGGSPAEGTAYANLWNGAYSSYPGDFLTAADGKVIQIDWSSGISGVTKIRYYSYNGNDRHQVNSGGWSANSGSGQGWKTAYSGSAITLTRLELQKADTVSYVKIGAIEINDQIVPFTSTTDSLVDTPTNGSQTDTGVGGEVRGNYCVWQPLKKTSGVTLSNGNLDVSTTGTTIYENVVGTLGLAEGKWYWEVTPTSGTFFFTGIAAPTFDSSDYIGSTADSYGYGAYNGQLRNNGSTSATVSTWAANDVIGIALDMDNGKLYFSKNGTWQSSSDPAAQTNPAYTGLTGTYLPATSAYDSTSQYANFGQRPFAYTAPSGFKALCTTNLDDPTIADGSTAMDAITWTGNGSTQTISGLNHSPDFIWHKVRSIAGGSQLYDIVRGVSKRLRSDTTDAESTVNGVTAFNSDGWTMTAGNNNNETYVSWTWDAGSSTVTNTDGSITSSVRANASAGFSIVSWTGASASGTVGHGLGVKPHLIIGRRRDSVANWCVYHISTGASQGLSLNSTNAAFANTSRFGGVEPTSTVFSVGSSGDINTGDALAYCFAPVDGYSSFGSYTGNGSADGPFVFTGMRPKFLIIKIYSGTTSNWVLLDAERDPNNVVRNNLYADTADAENQFDWADFTSNGFKLRVSYSQVNGSGYSYIYAAFAESPFKYARAR